MRAVNGRRVAVLAAAVGLAVAAADVHAQSSGSVTLAPTYQQSFEAYESGVADPVLGQQHFHAWGFMVGVERPGRFWQPHLWLQRYEFGRPCETPSDVVDCMTDGWSLAVGPGLQVVSTPRVSGILLPQVGLQSRGTALTGGAGLHVDVELGGIRPTGFARYHLIRGVHYASIGGGVIVRLTFRRD